MTRQPFVKPMIEPMTVTDIPAVVTLEQAAYNSFWSPHDYQHHLTTNRQAHYALLKLSHLVDVDESVVPTSGEHFSLRASWERPLPSEYADKDVGVPRGQICPTSGGSLKRSLRTDDNTVVGLSGWWLLGNEAHVITLAVHPNWQGQGWGEWLLWHLLDHAEALAASVATLEVRATNQPAIGLYHRYRFQEVGSRPRYYADEPGLILTTPPLSAPDYQAFREHRHQLFQQKLR